MCTNGSLTDDKSRSIGVVAVKGGDRRELCLSKGKPHDEKPHDGAIYPGLAQMHASQAQALVTTSTPTQPVAFAHLRLIGLGEFNMW